MRVLKQLADDEESEFPSAVTLLRECFYVDDALFGANDEATANSLRLELEKLLDRGGFKLHKWMASHKTLLDEIPISDQETTKCRVFDQTKSIKVLGIGWVPETDLFCFNSFVPDCSRYKKRSVLSVTAKLYDPLEWLSPVILKAKILIQELWIASYDWDDDLPPDVKQEWSDYCSFIPELQSISIPRWNHLESNETPSQIHGFADASTRAYAAVVYLRVANQNSGTHVTLLIAKTKVAPIKTISVPRLELCAAVLLAKLIEFVHNTMKLMSCRTYAWTDSTVVLGWLKQHPSEWPTFVANRVATIQHKLLNITWRHVPTAQNPADCASRGLKASELRDHPLWWQGPPWLKLNETMWPHAIPLPLSNETTKSAISSQSHVLTSSTQQWDLYNTISSWPKLLRVTAYCMRIAAHCRHKNIATDLRLKVEEVQAAKRHWIKTIQTESFPNEIQAFKSQNQLSRKSTLRALNPFLNEHQILRVGVRLQRSFLSYDEKHPIILPKHRISTLIVENAHKRALHGGPQLTTSLIRQSFWILGHRPFVRNIIHKCMPCARERAQVPQQLMGSLPTARSTPSRPFQHTGLDYAGPFFVRNNKGRGQKSHKAYLALFVCLSTRAVHFELVSDYSSDAFMAAYRRFVSRRGLLSDVYSDNGTTFKDADKELRALYKQTINDKNFGNLFATDQVQWHFIPPGASHFGGLWEAGVKCAKQHLRRVIGTQTLTFEELTTLFAQIEACLNSRPICQLDADPCEFAALTPGHFLIGTPLISVPEPFVLDLKESHLSRWQLVRQMIESFWKRRSVEYVQTLQKRTKWDKQQPNKQVGQLLLIRNPNLPPSKWLLGRVTECHPGSDSCVRVVTVKTSHSELKRPITQICILPVHAT